MRLVIVVLMVLTCAGCGSSDGSSTTAPAAECVADAAPAVVDGTLQDGEAAWVRFCPPPEGRPGWVMAPEAELSGRAAADLVSSWRGEDLATDCSQIPRAFEVQVGWADGTVSGLGVDTDRIALGPGAECAPGTVAAELVTALGVERDASYAAREPAPWPDCPSRLDLTGLDAAGESAADLGTWDGRPFSRQPILLATAARALVCAYASKPPRFDRSWELTGADAEEIRAVLQTATWPGEADCPLTPRPSYVVVLEDLTGTRRSASIDGPACGALSATIGTPPQVAYLGLGDRVAAVLASRD